jgi:hypothetical protein
MSGTAPLSPDDGWVRATNYADRISGDFDELNGKYLLLLSWAQINQEQCSEVRMAAATGDGVCVRIEASPAGSGHGDGGVLRTPSLFR